MKTILGYYGGKSRIAREIVPHIWAIPHDIYVEPFCGGCAILYAKGYKPVTNQSHYREVINDKNNCLITFWRVARENPDELERWIKLTPYSQAEYRRAISIYKNPSQYSDIEIAWAVYLQCNMSFSKKIGGGWAFNKSSKNSTQTWINSSLRLPECFERLKKVFISSEDALECIKRWDSPKTLLYLDPPYVGTNQGHYSGYSADDYQSLCNTLDNCQSSYILSGYPQEIQPKSAQKIVNIKATMSAAREKTNIKKERTEVLWICDRTIASNRQLFFCNALHQQ